MKSSFQMDYERRICHESYILNEIYNKNPNKLEYLKRIFQKRVQI